MGHGGGRATSSRSAGTTGIASMFWSFLTPNVLNYVTLFFILTFLPYQEHADDSFHSNGGPAPQPLPPVIGGGRPASPPSLRPVREPPVNVNPIDQRIYSVVPRRTPVGLFGWTSKWGRFGIPFPGRCSPISDVMMIFMFCSRVLTVIFFYSLSPPPPHQQVSSSCFLSVFSTRLSTIFFPSFTVSSARIPVLWSPIPWVWILHGTVGQNNQKYRLKYWAIHSSLHSFAPTAHSFACSALLALLARSAALTLLTPSHMGQ